MRRNTVESSGKRPVDPPAPHRSSSSQRERADLCRPRSMLREPVGDGHETYSLDPVRDRRLYPSGGFDHVGLARRESADWHSWPAGGRTRHGNDRAETIARRCHHLLIGARDEEGCAASCDRTCRGAAFSGRHSIWRLSILALNASDSVGACCSGRSRSEAPAKSSAAQARTVAAGPAFRLSTRRFQFPPPGSSDKVECFTGPLMKSRLPLNPAASNTST